ncbi:hypothetical protein NPIL_127721 [Nephila pilipes]|uniref:Uncharacterized protein n=1 Tax=Nephila pilipes TaxID=299642 RepID=A0A8X6TXH8_NEPPI|nr:hypothetical protein NPIL_127721 [Nephila pilipes]
MLTKHGGKEVDRYASRYEKKAWSLNGRSYITLRKCLSSDCSDTPVESSPEEKISIDDSPVASLSGFHHAENVTTVQMKTWKREIYQKYGKGEILQRVF